MNFFIIVLAVWFYYLQNRYFGWNKTPNSSEELICDGIVIILIAMSFI